MRSTLLCFFSVIIEVVFLVKAFRDQIRFLILVMWVEYDHGILLNLLKSSSVMLSIRDFQLEIFVFKFTFRQMNFRSSIHEVVAFCNSFRLTNWSRHNSKCVFDISSWDITLTCPSTGRVWLRAYRQR